MPVVEARERYSIQNFKHLEAVAIPGDGGRREQNLSLGNTVIIARPNDNLPPSEPTFNQVSGFAEEDDIGTSNILDSHFNQHPILSSEDSQPPQNGSFWTDNRPVVLDDINRPNSGGKLEPSLVLADTEVIVRPSNRNSRPVEPQQTHYPEVQMRPGLGENSRLKNTGFNLVLEAMRYFQNYNQNLKDGKTPEQALTITTDETELNIRNYIREFVQAGVVLPDAKKIQEVEGIRRMVGNNGVPVIDGITKKERYGSVWDAAMQSDQYLSEPIPQVESEKNVTLKVAVTNSSRGWNGIARPYVDNQTIVSWVDEFGILHGATLVTDIDQVQSRQLSIDLGVDENLLTGETEAERVSNIVRNPALFTFPKSDKNPAEHVFGKILALRGRSDIRLEQLDGSVEIRPVEGAEKDLKRLDELLKFNQNCEKYLAVFRELAFSKLNSLNDWLSQQEIVSKIEQTVLLITDDHLPNLSPVQAIWVSNYNVGETRQPELDDRILMNRLNRAAAFLETRAGCSQGGDSMLTQLRGISLGSGVGSTGGIFGGEGGKKGKKCINCGERNYCTKTCYRCDGMLI